MACQNFKTFVHKSDSSPEALCNLGSGSWLAWANDTAAQYAAIHCRRQQTIGPTDDDDDDDDDDESMKLMFAHSYRKKTVTSVLMKICSGKQSSQKTYHHTNQPDYAFTPSPVNYYCVDYIMWTHQSHSVAVVKNRFIQWIWYIRTLDTCLLPLMSTLIKKELFCPLRLQKTFRITRPVFLTNTYSTVTATKKYNYAFF